MGTVATDVNLRALPTLTCLIHISSAAGVSVL